jgi:hypothetical protein
MKALMLKIASMDTPGVSMRETVQRNARGKLIPSIAAPPFSAGERKIFYKKRRMQKIAEILRGEA